MWRKQICLVAVAFIGSLIASPARPAAASVIQHQLNQTLPEVRFDGVAITDAIDFLRDVSGANISVNWRSLNEQGITPDSTITMRLRQVSLRKARGADSFGSGRRG